MLPFLFAYILFFFLNVFRAHENVIFCLISTKKALNCPNNLIYITTDDNDGKKRYFRKIVKRFFTLLSNKTEISGKSRHFKFNTKLEISNWDWYD